MNTANRRIWTIALAGSVMALTTGVASGQVPQIPFKKKDSSKQVVPDPNAPQTLGDRIMRAVKTHDWLVSINIHISPPRQVDERGMPVGYLKFSTAAVVFPILSESAFHTFAPGALPEMPANFKGEMFFADRLVTSQMKLQDGYHSGTRLGRWEMRDMEGLEADLKLTIPITSREIVFNEEEASKIPWPTVAWPAVAASTFKPQYGVDFIENEAEKTATDKAVKALLDKWTGGKDPKAVPPVQLAKFLMGRVLEHVQSSGDGLNFNRNGSFQGFALQGVLLTLQQQRGTEHDIPCVLASVYRNAGIPARTVIGYDLSESKGSRNIIAGKTKSGKMRTWVEFCVLDPTTNKEIWIPADINRQRRQSSRVPDFNMPWKYFGGHDEGDYLLPLAFQFHPPTTVQAHGSPCLWGWLTTPETQVAEQFMTITTITAPKRGDDPDPNKRNNR